MKILVTGASGAIAEAVINTLLEKGIEVIATSRSEEKVKHCQFFSKVQYIPFDIEKDTSSDLFSFFKRPDSIIHLAWDKLSEPNNPTHTTSILRSHQNFLSNLIFHGLKDINCIGTAYEYGLKEGEQVENSTPEPIVEYAIGKNMLRVYLEKEQLQFNFTLKWIRIFNVFGKGKSGTNLFSLLEEAIASKQDSFNMSGGEQVRDYLSPIEVGNIIVRIALQKKVLGIINCSSGKPIKLKDMIQNYLYWAASSLKLNLGHYPYLNHEPMVQWGSTEKLNKIPDSNNI